MYKVKTFLSGMAAMALIISIILNIILISVRFETLPDATIFGYNLHQQKAMDELVKELNK